MEHFQHITCGMKNISAYLIVFHSFTRETFSTMVCHTKERAFHAISESLSTLANFSLSNQNNLPLIQTTLGLSFPPIYFKCSHFISFFLEVQSMWITFSIKFQCPELLMRSSLCPDIDKQHWLPNWHLEIQDKNLLCGWVTLDSSYAKPGVGLDEFIHSFIRYLWSAPHVPSSNSWRRNVKKAITAQWMIYLSVSP